MSTITLDQPKTPAGRRSERFRWSVAEYRRLGELGFFDNKRVELIHGEIVPMSPINWPHVQAKSLLADLLREAYLGTCFVHEQAPFPTLDSIPEPDLSVHRGTLRDYTDHPTNPILVVEVSHSTLEYDLTTKLELYAEAGVPEYWVLDVEGRELYQFTKPVKLTPGGSSYTSHRTMAAQETVEAPGTGTQLLVSAMLP